MLLHVRRFSFEDFMRRGLLFLIFLLWASSARGADVGDVLPSFSLRGAEGRVYASDQFRGRVLVLYFMGYA